MIITSNSVNHKYTIPNVTIVGDVDGFENVAEKVEIYLHSSVTFDHTYDTVLYSDPGTSGVSTSVTEEKTVTEFTHFNVDLNTSGITAESFAAWDDLEEDEVVQWCLDSDTVRMQEIQAAQEAKVLEAKDKVLNPKKYYRDMPVTPWRRRADEAAALND